MAPPSRQLKPSCWKERSDQQTGHSTKRSADVICPPLELSFLAEGSAKAIPFLIGQRYYSEERERTTRSDRGAMYRGACPHTAFKAGGNEMAQLSVADKGVATTSEKYTIAHSNHVGLNTSPYNGRTCQCWSKMGSRPMMMSRTEASMNVLRSHTQDNATSTMLRLSSRLRGSYC